MVFAFERNNLPTGNTPLESIKIRPSLSVICTMPIRPIPATGLFRLAAHLVAEGVANAAELTTLKIIRFPILYALEDTLETVILALLIFENTGVQLISPSNPSVRVIFADILASNIPLPLYEYHEHIM